MPHATIHGHDLYYERAGSGEPLLLVMGMSGTHRTWGRPFLDALRADFDVVVYDHRGIGRSSRAEAGYSIADLSDDAAALLDELGWDSAHVVGISMGGMVAQELALRHPDRVRTLTLGCTYAGGAGSALTSEATFGRLGEAWSSGDRERALRVAWEVNVSRAFAADDDQYAAFREAALAVPAALPAILAQMQAIGGHDTSERLGGIQAPTLIVHGTEDEMLPVSNAHAIAERMPDARLEIWDGVGHLFFWERPEESARLVREHAGRAAAV
ncbi:MAG TPA: alpha/beta hydrolase [Capillimicrobium sp.]|nr:alpha/beta hydrolase [Capillimicrobium sp.]